MNEPEINLPNTPRSFDDIDAIESLRRQVNLLLGALLVSSFTLTLYLGVQARWITTDDNGARANLNEAARTSQQEYASDEAKLNMLTEFARTHPDFQNQILFKYRLNEAPVAPKK